ncbi:MAG: HlyD family type I secretion periplasmic adaptor subunit [Pseudohongiellaceae bacterium]
MSNLQPLSAQPAPGGMALATIGMASSGPTLAGIETGIERPRRIGLAIAFVVFGVFGLWSVFAPIDGAAYAMGTIRVSSYNKVVQHLEGGIVKSIHVKNGDMVEAGQVLLEMDPTQAFSQLEILSGQQLTLTALEARLLAERDESATIGYPALLTAAGVAGQAEQAAQNQIFATRKAARDGEIAVLQQRIGQLESRVSGLKALLQSKSVLAASFQDELDDFRPLLAEGFTDKQRLRELERNQAVAAGEVAELTATIASTEIQIGETRLQIIQTNNQFQDEVANQLAEVQAQLKYLRERITALQDIVTRTEVRAPITGLVNNLQTHTEGAVIGPGAPIAEIVPQSDDLIIEAAVQPIDIDRVAAGQTATVRLSALNSKSVPNLHGTVIGVSADALTDQNTGGTYYSARIALTPESLESLTEFELVPGMPAEVFISTGSRSFLQYMLKPLMNATARSLRED